MKKYIIILIMLISGQVLANPPLPPKPVDPNVTNIYNIYTPTKYNYSGIATAIAAAGHHFDAIDDNMQVSVSMGVLEYTSAYSIAFAQRYKDVLLSASYTYEEADNVAPDAPGSTSAVNIAAKWTIK